MKRAIIVHCWGGNPDYAWYPWLKKGLEAKGYTVAVPEMPDTEEPTLEKWLPVLKKAVDTPDEELLLIGHSLGCITIMRYLESLKEGQKIDKAILVAGFTDQLGYSELDSFFMKLIDFPKIKKRAKNGFAIIQSDNDPYVPMQYAERLKQELDASLTVKHGAKHMSGPVDEEESCLELPEVLKAVA